MTTSDWDAKTKRAQHFVADSMCAFHKQLAAVFRGDAHGARAASQEAAYATAEAIRAARDLLYNDKEEGEEVSEE